MKLLFHIVSSKVCQNAGVLRILTCKSASRHSGVPSFDIWTSKSTSATVSFLAFWVTILLRATAACHFLDISTSISGPELLCFVHFDWKMLFFSSPWTATSALAPLASLLFEHLEPKTIEKTQENRDFPNISRVCIFFLLTLLAWLYSRVDLPSSELTSLLCFSTVHIVGSYTSKLPSTIQVYIVGCQSPVTVDE